MENKAERKKKKRSIIVLGILILDIVLIGLFYFYFANKNKDEKTPETETGFQMDLVWQDENKKPEDYTYEEYEALSEEEQLAFQDSFEDFEYFNNWLRDALDESPKLPWETGEKSTVDYTYEEYEALSEEEQLAFQESFETFDDFDEWLRNSLNGREKFPWETGEKSPIEYTYEEYEELDEEEQLAFQESFETFEDFSNWLQSVTD